MKNSKQEGKPYYSPTDLNNFVSCKYHIKSDLLKDELNLKKKEKSANLKLRIDHGIKHEQNYFTLLKKENKKSVTIDPKQPDNKKFTETVDALKKGYDLIYKAFLIDEDFRGEVDFLIKVKNKSKLGNYSYEVYDTKVTKSLKPKHVLQITSYSYLLSKIQELTPKQMYLIDGGNKTHTFKTAEFLDYFLYTKNNFERFLPKAKNINLYPEKCSFCGICSWQEECEKIWEKDNYINQICGIKSSQVVKLKKENIKTIKDFVNIKLDKIKSKINLSTKKKLYDQAVLQEEKRITNKSRFVINETEKNKGLYKIPKPNEGDLFYDIEGFPQADKRNFEYLHGIYFSKGKKKEFKYFGVKKYEKEEEKRIFIDLINFLEKHFNKYPHAYIYHYNDYEKRALRELASEFSSSFPKGNNFVDRLLRQEKFVDLYRVVSQCMQTTEKNLSLKTIEIFYREERAADIKTADDSIRLFDDWCSTNDKNLMKNIIDYNEEDCISTHDLRNFLLDNRPNDYPWFSQTEEEKDKNTKVKDFEVKETSILLKLESKKKTGNSKVIDELINLVGFHRREDKSKYWAKFDRLEKTPEELEDDPECIANAKFIKKVAIKDSDKTTFIYKFNEQNFKIKEGDSAFDIISDTTFGTITKITEIKDDENYIECTLGKKRLDKVGEPPKNFDFGPGSVINSSTIATALNRFIIDYSESTKTKYKCAEDILKNNFPDLLKVKIGEPIFDIEKDLIEESTLAVKKLNSSYLLVQGPPGSGKTFTSAKIILSLIKDNKTVGITSNSHKAINNLLMQIENLALEENFTFKGLKKSSKDEQKLNGKIIEDISGGMKDFPKDYLLHAGTAWLFSDPRYDQQIDYLFVDEAGQVALANTLAIATSAKNIILIGDQMQLSQPIQGVHAGNSGKSALDFLLEGEDTIPVSKGIFLSETRRLNKNICDYISSSFYDFRLKSHPVTNDRSVSLDLKNIKNEGIFYLPTNHVDCTQKSDEEAEIISTYYNKIIGKDYKENGKIGKIGHDDVMVVAPFNMQVNNLEKILNEKDARIGTIDKFQGQESKVVFISMTSSDPENLPRHKEFFFSRNRLNVAISRAQCVAIILFNSSLLLTDCQKINEMRLVNNFCKLLKYEIK